MARELGVGTTTIRSHVEAVLHKLGAHSRLEAAAYATRYGLAPRRRGAGQVVG
jgi:two-component system nitrate/nitrite response regulator NarL